MITIKRLLETTKSLLTNPRALAVLAILYALLLATLYGFISIREATVWQVVLTMLFLALIPVEFFVLQATILQQARAEKFHWKQIGRDAIKLAIVSIPIILLGWLLYYLLNKWQAHFPAPAPLLTTLPDPKAPIATQPLHWPTVLFATVRCLLLGVVLPLATIHLWIEVAGRDLRASLGSGAGLKRIGIALARGFAFDSVLTYALGLIIFVLVPYTILFATIQVKGNKTDFTVFVLRLVLVYVFTLIGWTVTLSALARSNPEASAAVPVGTVPNAPAEAPA
jgi:hypothetical protein